MNPQHQIHNPPHFDKPFAPSLGAEEALVSDARSGLTPAQMVDRKLVSLLKAAPLPLSRLQGGGPPRPRP